MFWIVLACTIGSSGPATPGSQSAIESANMATMAETAGELSNASRELEAASSAARKRIQAGADPAVEAEKLATIMDRIEGLEAELQTQQVELEKRIGAAQSTDETRK